VRYASVALTASSPARAQRRRPVTYRISTPGGQILGTGATTGAGAGRSRRSLSTIAAGYPFVVSEVRRRAASLP